MYVGHYGVSYALRATDEQAKVSHLFMGVQLADVAWSTFVMLGIEKVRMVPGFLAASSLDLYYMPYTHSLVGALIWSVLTSAVYYFLRRGDAAARRKTALVMGASVFSHWLLDLLVHGPDLGLVGDTHKVGLGLWHYPVVTMLLESAIFLGGLWLYLRRTRAKNRLGRWGVGVLAAYLLLMNAVDLFVLTKVNLPVPMFAAAALGSYFLFAALAGWLDRQREQRAVA